jgi:hypothetical protein
MPRRIRTARRPGLTYGEGHRLHLLTGHDFFSDGFGEGAFFRRDDAARAWAYLRQELLVEWIADHPCTRPWAWWEFEDHPPRRVVKPKPSDIMPEPTRPWPWGKPLPWWDEYRQAKWYESQPTYLHRHDLLTRAEAAYLEAHPELLNPVSALQKEGR